MLDNPTLNNDSTKCSLTESAIGKYVLVRTVNEGINAGFLEDADKTGVILKDAKRLWYYKPKDNLTAWYEGVANTGLHKDSKVSCSVKRKYIIEDYSITLCSDVAAKSIQEKQSHGS